MEDEKIETPTIYDLENIVERVEQAVDGKAVKDNIFNLSYMIGNVTEEDLLDIGFKCFGPTNKAGYVTYMYRIGNIEAVFIEEVLHIYDLRK